MPCIQIPNGIVCLSPFFRLPLEDGTRVYMDWHHYCCPTFYKDKAAKRVVEEWWEDERICKALNWFIKRGEKA